MAARPKIFMGLALVHFQNYWLLSEKIKVNQQVQVVVNTVNTTDYGRPMKPFFIEIPNFLGFGSTYRLDVLVADEPAVQL